MMCYKRHSAEWLKGAKIHFVGVCYKSEREESHLQKTSLIALFCGGRSAFSNAITCEHLKTYL